MERRLALSLFLFIISLLIYKSMGFVHVNRPVTKIKSTITSLEAASLAYFAAGGLAASFSHAVAVPIDVVKTKIQTEPRVYTGGIVMVGKKIVKNIYERSYFIGTVNGRLFQKIYS